MKLRMMALLVAGAGAAAWMGACGKPSGMECTSQHGGFAAKYTLKSGDPACLGLKGEIIGMQRYNPANPPGSRLAQNPDIANLAIRTSYQGDLVAGGGVVVDADAGTSVNREDPNADHSLNAVGQFDTPQPNADGICTVADLSEARQEWPVITNPDGGANLAPAETSVFKWSKVKMLVTPDAPGTQMEGEMTYTGTAGCTASYAVSAVWPAVSCEDDDGNPDESLCAKGGLGASLNPDFAITCDPDTLLCVMAKPLPSYK